MQYDAILFAFGVGLIASTFVILGALIRRAKKSYVVEKADLIQTIEKQIERKLRAPVKSSSRPEWLREVPRPVLAGPSVGEQVLRHSTFERTLLAEALRIVNKET